MLQVSMHDAKLGEPGYGRYDITLSPKDEMKIVEQISGKVSWFGVV
jgi:hypothetical protein